MDVRGGSMGLLSNVETHREMDYTLEALEILDEASKKQIPVSVVMDRIYQEVIKEALRECGSVDKASRLIGCARSGLSNHMKKFGIRKGDL